MKNLWQECGNPCQPEFPRAGAGIWTQTSYASPWPQSHTDFLYTMGYLLIKGFKLEKIWHNQICVLEITYWKLGWRDVSGTRIKAGNTAYSEKCHELKRDLVQLITVLGIKHGRIWCRRYVPFALYWMTQFLSLHNHTVMLGMLGEPSFFRIPWSSFHKCWDISIFVFSYKAEPSWFLLKPNLPKVYHSKCNSYKTKN